MKQVIRNTYIKEFRFSSEVEASTFFKNQQTERSLSLDDTFGDSYYCYVGYHSLTREKQFVLSFSSDAREENLNFLFWDDLFVLDTGESMYLIDENLHVKASLEITTPLVGLYLIRNDRLLILEEAYLRIINSNGDLVKAEWFDLMEDFSMTDQLLSIQTSEGNKVIELN